MLLGSRLLSELLGSDFTTALVALHSAESTQSSKDVVFSSLTNGSEFLGLLSASDGKNSSGHLLAGGGGLELLSGRVVDQTALGLALTTWEEDELRLVRVESLNVELQLLLGGVGSSVINGDADSASEIGGETGMLQFVEGEAAAVSDLASVAAGRRRNNWAEFLDWARESAGGLCDSTLVSSKLLGGLIEVALCSTVPVLSEVDVCYGVVVLDHC